MSQDQAFNDEPLKKLAELLRECQEHLPKAPAVTDQHILRAMLGKPWGLPQAAPQEIRKAG